VLQLHLLRRAVSADDARTNHARRRLSLLLIGLLAAASALTLAGSQQLGARDSALASQLVHRLVGAESRSPLVLHPRRNVAIGVSSAGLIARNRQHTLVFGLQDAQAGPWVRHSTGAIRQTSFGSEVVRCGLPASEEYLVVKRHLGKKTLTWQLGAGVRPILQGGGVHLVDSSGRPLNLELSTARILDLSGRDITPRGLAWSTSHRGDQWLLRLRIDDRNFPAG